MEFTRIESVLDTAKTTQSKVALFGTGGSAGLAGNLARCGVGRFVLFDFDAVSLANVPRQQHDATDVGRPKVAALADALRRVNPAVVVEVVEENFLTMNAAQLDALLTDVDLMIFATDNFAAQARGNIHALRLGKPALWIGLYAGGLAGEIIYWHPGIDACFRCLCSSRFAAHASADGGRQSLDPASDGCTIFDVSLLDSIAGMLAVGLLTRGSDNRFGRLIEELGNRNFIQVQLDRSWTVNGRQPVRRFLGVADDCPAFFAWNTIVRADPDRGLLPCPDCENYRGHYFFPMHGGFLRMKD